MTARRLALVSLGVLVALSLLSWGCHSETPLAGVYRSSAGSDGSTVAEMKLEADGKGAWKVGKESTSFKWESRGPEVWLHYKSGGVVRGTVAPDHSIDIQVPGVGPIHFEKTK